MTNNYQIHVYGLGSQVRHQEARKIDICWLDFGLIGYCSIVIIIYKFDNTIKITSLHNMGSLYPSDLMWIE